MAILEIDNDSGMPVSVHANWGGFTQYSTFIPAGQKGHLNVHAVQYDLSVDPFQGNSASSCTSVTFVGGITRKVRVVSTVTGLTLQVLK